MWERFFQPLSEKITACRYSFTTMLPTNRVSTLFARRQLMNELSNQWPELQPQKVNISQPEMLALETLTGSNAEVQKIAAFEGAFDR